uniref:Peptidase S1 domain-containing protein n=1 Tax=Arion vulgaris TaxID=1028688 RepID=A0A0B6ZSG2_9EUPU
MLIYIFLAFVSVFQIVTSQYFTTLAGRCDNQTAYFYGGCRVRACLANEVFLQGSSYCDIYRAYLRTPYVRCTSTLPCCFRGGLCRQSCSAGENRLSIGTDCAVGRRGVCCVPNIGTNVSTVANVSRGTNNPTGTNVPTRTNVPSGTNVPTRTNVLAGTHNQTRINVPSNIPVGTNGPIVTNIQESNDVPTRVPVTQRPGQCGTRNSVRGRIIGAGVPQHTSWPWMVRLVYLGSAHSVCLGALVDNITVLTVAHCVVSIPANQLQVRIGDFDAAQTEPDEETIGVRNIQVNRNFIPGRRGNDFAVLTLDRAVQFTQNKLPVCLPDSTTRITATPQCFVSGWGITETGQVGSQLLTVPVRLMNHGLCNVMIASTSSTSSISASLTNDTICTESPRNTSGCPFDDGSMLSCLDTSNRYILIGLVTEYSCETLPTVYTRVDNFTEAIVTRF